MKFKEAWLITKIFVKTVILFIPIQIAMLKFYDTLEQLVEESTGIPLLGYNIGLWIAAGIITALVHGFKTNQYYIEEYWTIRQKLKRNKYVSMVLEGRSIKEVDVLRMQLKDLHNIKSTIDMHDDLSIEIHCVKV